LSIILKAQVTVQLETAFCNNYTDKYAVHLHKSMADENI